MKKRDKMETYDKRPERVIRFNDHIIVVNYNITAVEDGYICSSVTVPDLHYSTVVSAVIRSRYSQDDVEAIQLNYLSDPTSRDEFDALQTWRTMAKEIAREVTDDDPDE